MINVEVTEYVKSMSL